MEMVAIPAQALEVLHPVAALGKLAASHLGVGSENQPLVLAV